MMLIECPDGKEKCVVPSMSGYPGWRLVANNVPSPPPHGVWNGTGWTVNQTAADQAELLRKVRNAEELAVIIADLTARIKALEAK